MRVVTLIVLLVALVIEIVVLAGDKEREKRKKEAEEARLKEMRELRSSLEAIMQEMRENASKETERNTFDDLTKDIKEFARLPQETSFAFASNKATASDETKIKVEDELEYMPTIEVDGTNFTSEELIARAVKIEASNKADTNAVQQLEKPDVADEKLYTLTEIEPIVGLAHRTLVKYVNEGKLRATKINRAWHVRESDLKEFMNGSETK